MKELEVEFIGRGEVRGFLFRQIARTENAYLYEVTTESGSKHYEAFERKENTHFNTITYPSAKAFGNYAYTTMDYARAKELMQSIDMLVKSKK